jgi:hypothetical protein
VHKKIEIKFPAQIKRPNDTVLNKRFLVLRLKIGRRV